MDPAPPEALNERFGVPGVVRFETVPAGFVRAVVTTEAADAHVYLHGAHVTHYRPRHQLPVLFLSTRARFEPGAALRGGVPVIFPWFGPRPGYPSAVQHGIVRTAAWTVESTHHDGTIVLRLDAASVGWPQPFALRSRMSVGTELDLTLEIENTSGEPFAFEAALHSYLAVSDVRLVTLTGLAGATYADKTAGMARRTESHDPVRITAETDRVYVDTRATCVVEDAGWRRRLIVAKDGSRTTVVWNPWSEKGGRIADLGDDEWARMLCVETANALDDAVTLPAGARHTLRTVIRSEPLAA
jgi:glucose-6-phosphate 1-epimerase